MLPDRLFGLFQENFEIELPDVEREEPARRLERVFVRCVNPLDRDQAGLKEAYCTGRVYLSPRHDEHANLPRCGECERVVSVDAKQRFRSLRLRPEAAAVTAFMGRLLSEIGLPARSAGPGELHIVGKALVRVHVVGLRELRAKPRQRSQGGGTDVYVIADDPSAARYRRMREGMWYPLVELALDRPTFFQEQIRALANHQVSRVGPRGPRPVARSPEPLPERPVTGLGEGPPLLCVNHVDGDRALWKELEIRLIPLRRQGILDYWDRGQALSGEPRRSAMREHLARAKLVALLISAEAVADLDWLEATELALGYVSSGAARVIPILLRHTPLESTPLAELQVLPQGRPVFGKGPRDEVWSEIVRAIRQALPSGSAD
jgi:hypothetical protein